VATRPRFVATQIKGVADRASSLAAISSHTTSPCYPRRSIMTSHGPLTRSERLALARAALRGVLSGAARAAITWLLVHLGA
jgi:hypothetical protein